jgi:hypothetical protein
MTTTDAELKSPLGGPAERAAIAAAHPALEDVIFDLERTITPEFHAADQDAITTQQAIKRNRLAEICGSALVATLAIIGLARDGEWAWGASAGVLAGLTAAFALHGRRQDLDRWLDRRRIAEELRSLYFTTLVSAADRDSIERRKMLRTATDDIIAPEFVRARDEPARPGVAEDRTVGGAVWQVYRSERLRSQIDWMESKSRTVADRSRRLAWVQIGLLASAAIAGFAIATVEISDADWTGDLVTWLGVVVAASAGLVSLAASADGVVAGERLADNYVQTVARLRNVERDLDGDAGRTSDVAEIEWLLLGEHRSWRRITKEYNS